MTIASWRLGLALLAIGVTPLSAQSHPQVREGFTVSVGVGAGSARLECDVCGAARRTEPTMYLRLGTAYRPNLVLAWEVNAWARTVDDGSDELKLTLGTGNFLAQWYPRPSSGFFLNGGVGAGGAIIEVTSPTPANRLNDDSFGFGYQLGAGYDVRLRRNFSITPFATYFATAGASFSQTGIRLNGKVLEAGIGVTWH